MKHILAFLLLFGCVLFLFCGCRSSDYYEKTFFSMDTVVTLRLSAFRKDGSRLSEEYLVSVACESEAILDRIERSISRTRTDSEVYRLNASSGGIDSTNEDFLCAIRYAQSMAEQTNGAYSPALGTLTDLWNVTGGGHVPTPEELAGALAHADYRTLSVTGCAVEKQDAGTRVDLGGIGKGYAAAELITYLNTTDIAWGLISLGGNVGVFGEKPDGSAYTIGITDPQNTAAIAGYWQIRSGFLSVSGDYERYFVADGVKYHHILDPERGCPADSGIRSAAVWSEDGMLADALSTALFVMGAENALEYYYAHPGTFEAILITKDNTIIQTSGLAENEAFSLRSDIYSFHS